MKLKAIYQFSYSTLVLALMAALLFTQCKHKDDSGSMTEETTTEMETSTTSTVEMTPPPVAIVVVKERPQLTTRHKAKANIVHKEPERYNEVKHEDLVQAPTKETGKTITFVPHRPTYIPWNTVEDVEVEEVKELEPVRKLTEFDTPPIFAFEECQDNKHLDHCSHVRMQRFFDKNINKRVSPGDSQDHVEYVSFVVKTDGTVDPSFIEVVDQTPHCEPCAEEAKRVVKMMNDWKPGTWNGQNVDVRVTLPVRFHAYEI